jgi:NCAIR mutase (PurE)-related protein
MELIMTQETEKTTLLEDLEDIVTSLQSGKIDEKQTIEVLNNIVNYEKEIEFKKNKNKRYSTMLTFRFPFYHNYDIENDVPKTINKDMYNDFIGYISEQGTENIKRQFDIEYDTTEKTLYEEKGE